MYVSLKNRIDISAGWGLLDNTVVAIKNYDTDF